MLTEAELIDFENEIAGLFEQKKIRAPIHLVSGNEAQLIEIFKQITPESWVFSNHRSHLHALLKGIPREWLKQEILNGHSITLNNAEYRFFSSAIVGGVLPIATGVAMGGDTVWCFVGDMAAESGIFHECTKYASGHNLPITFVVEDNGKSVCTDTKEVWGRTEAWGLTGTIPYNTIYYQYKNKWPHQGIGTRVEF